MVRKLKLNRKKTSRGNNRVQLVNIDNLNKIKCTRSKHIHNISTKVKLTSINIQSLKTKELTIIEHLGSNDADKCIVTETWLNKDAKFNSKVVNSAKMVGNVITSTEGEDEEEA